MKGFAGDSVIKNPCASVGDMSSVPGLVRSLGEGNSNPFQYCCLGNPMDKGWWATVRVRHGLANEHTHVMGPQGSPLLWVLSGPF